MTPMGRLMAAWPWIHGGLLALTLWRVWWAVPLVLYVLPPVLHRLHGWVCPLQEGAFPFPVKYGYALVGTVEDGAPDLAGRTVFVLHGIEQLPMPEVAGHHRISVASADSIQTDRNAALPLRLNFTSFTPFSMS